MNLGQLFGCREYKAPYLAPIECLILMRIYLPRRHHWVYLCNSDQVNPAAVGEDAVVAYLRSFRKHPKTWEEISEATGLSPVEKLLKRMVQKGIIVKTGTRKCFRYTMR